MPTAVAAVLAGETSSGGAPAQQSPAADDSLQSAATAVVAAFAEQDRAASAATVRAVCGSEQITGLVDAVAAAEGTAFGGEAVREALLVRVPPSSPTGVRAHPEVASRGRRSCAPWGTNTGRAAISRSSWTRPAACSLPF